MKSERIIGIVGGMGPEAGIDLARLITEQTLAECDQEHIPQVLFSLPGQINDRTEYLLKKSGPNPADTIANILISMESVGVEIAGLACNTAHAPDIFNTVEHHLAENNSKIKLLNMVKEVAGFLKKESPNATKVGILGTNGTFISRQYNIFNQFNIKTIYLPEPKQNELHQAIYDPRHGIKANASKIPEQARLTITRSLETLIEIGADAVVLACTELSFAYPSAHFKHIPVLNSSLILARALINAHSPEKLKPLNSQ